MKRKLLICAAAIAIPLLLWLDVWLAIQFGNWVNVTIPSAEGSGGGFLGSCAFMVLAVAQGLAIGTMANDTNA